MLCALQNGTTNSAHELVDKLNKADLPSSVGEYLPVFRMKRGEAV